MIRCRIVLTCLLMSGITLLAVAADNEPTKDQQGDPLPIGALARLGTVHWRHDERVAFAAFLPDGKSVVSVGDDLTIRVWEYPSGKQLRRIDLAPNEKPPVDRDQRKFVQAAALSGDGKILATFVMSVSTEFREPTIRLHDLTTGKELKGVQASLKGLEVTAFAFSPDGEQLAVLNRRGVVRLWDWAKQMELATFEFHDDRTGASGTGLLYAPDGKTLATINDQVVNLWDPATSKKTHSFSLDTKDSRVYSAAFSPDSKTFAFSSSDRFITIVETDSGKKVHKLSLETNSTQALLFSKDGSKIYGRSSKDRERQLLQEWDVKTGKMLREFSTGPQPEGSQLRGPLSLSPDGKTLLLAGFRQAAQFIDLGTGKEIVVDRGEPVALETLQFTPDSKTILTVGTDAAVRQWDALTGKDGRLLNDPDQRVYAVSADGKTLAVQLPDSKNLITLIDTATGKAIGEVTLKEREALLRLLFAPNGKVLAVRKYMEQKLDLYEVPSAKPLYTFDIKTGAPQPKGGPGGGSRSPRAAQTLIFSADSQTLASYADAKKLTLWNVATGQRLGVLALPEGNPVQSGAFSPDGRCLAVDRSDGVVTVYELATGQPRRSYGVKREVLDNEDLKKGLYQTPFAQMPGVHVAFSPDDKLLVHAGLDRAVHVFDLFSGKELAAFKGHTAEINAVAFAPNGKTIASASADTTALVWEASKAQSPARPDKALTPDELKAHWQTLADNDAGKAFAALTAMIASPKETVAFLKEQVKPAAPLDLKRAQELIAQLDDNQASERQKATGDLLEVGEQVVPIIDKTLATDPPLEVRKRLEDVRKQLTDPILKGETLRLYRAVEVLEDIGTPEARTLLQALADGAPAGLLTKSAQAALKR